VAEYKYLDPATTTAQQWAWEFLRRNSDYHDDYSKLIAFQENDNPEINKLANEAINSALNWPMQFTTATKTLPVAFLVDHILPYLHKKKEFYPWIPEVCWRLIEKYNLRCPLNPARPYLTGGGWGHCPLFICWRLST